MGELERAIIEDLRRHSAISPESACEARELLDRLACPGPSFDRAVARLSDLGLIGAVGGQLYVKPAGREMAAGA